MNFLLPIKSQKLKYLTINYICLTFCLSHCFKFQNFIYFNYYITIFLFFPIKEQNFLNFCYNNLISIYRLNFIKFKCNYRDCYIATNFKILLIFSIAKSTLYFFQLKRLNVEKNTLKTFKLKTRY